MKVQRRLGHESYATTEKIYDHLLPDVDTEVVEVLDRLLPSLAAVSGDGVAA